MTQKPNSIKKNAEKGAKGSGLVALSYIIGKVISGLIIANNQEHHPEMITMEPQITVVIASVVGGALAWIANRFKKHYEN